MSENEIDEYLGALDEPKRATLTRLRDTIAAIVPEAEECISYGLPAFKLRGKTIAGFAAFKSHLSYLPHSGSVITQLARETEGYASTKGSLHFPVDRPLPRRLVKKLLDVRMAEALGPRDGAAEGQAGPRARVAADGGRVPGSTTRGSARPRPGALRHGPRSSRSEPAVRASAVTPLRR